MTYFHRRTSTIIGAKAFHGPVRDGKEWVHFAMVVKRNLSRRSRLRLVEESFWRAANLESAHPPFAGQAVMYVACVCMDCWDVLACLAQNHNHQGYRIKPHGQLVLVS
jgi:hypothetical protein